MHHAAADVACWHAVDAMASSPEAESASDEAADGSSDEATRWDSILRAAEMSPRKGTPWESAPATSRHMHHRTHRQQHSHDPGHGHTR